MSFWEQLLPGIPRILGAFVLVAAAMAISRWQSVGLEKDMLVAVVRAFVQLMSIGYVLELIFTVEQRVWIGVVVTVMVLVAGQTAGRRAAQMPHSRWVATISVATGTALTLGMLILLDVFPFTPRFIIPIAGMIIGNSMVVTALVLDRLRGELKLQQARVEAALALGATARQAARRQMRRSLTTGMMPIIDNTKTVGLISLPGAMTGMILGGASPLEAVQVQAIVMYMLIGAAAISGLAATFLGQPRFFTRFHQLVYVALVEED